MEIEKGYKQTDVGVIPNDWEVLTIGNACKLINGRGFKPFEWKTEGLPIIRIQNLNGSDEYNYYQGVYDKKLEIERGRLLFAWSGSRGTSFGPHVWDGPKGLLNYHTWKIEIDEKNIDKHFFTHALKNLTKYIEDKAHGASALVHIQKWEMEGFKFPLPKSKKEQTAIATALSNTDALITSLESLIAKKRNIKQGTMQELLKPKKGWQVKRLGEISRITIGQSPLSEYYNDKGIGLPLIQGNGDIESRKTIVRFYTSFVTKKGRLGDIIMSVRAPVGEIARATFDCCLGRGVCAITYDNDYLYHYLIFLEKSWTKLSSGSTFDSVNSKQIRELEVEIPESKEAEIQIAAILNEMDLEISALQSKLSKYRQIKSGMMQNLLTGKIRLV